MNKPEFYDIKFDSEQGGKGAPKNVQNYILSCKESPQIVLQKAFTSAEDFLLHGLGSQQYFHFLVK